MWLSLTVNPLGGDIKRKTNLQKQLYRTVNLHYFEHEGDIKTLLELARFF